MADNSLLNEINDWLVAQALDEPDIVPLFDKLCGRLTAIGIPVHRAMLVWSTLHPLFQAEMVIFERGKPTELNQFVHQDTESELWLRSPMRFMLQAGLTVLRRRLTGEEKLLDFTILDDLAGQGLTDYLLMSTELFGRASSPFNDQRGIFISWATDRPTGFTDGEVGALQRMQRLLALACKTVIQRRIARNISEAYLGRLTGDRVLNGLIRLGHGEVTRALVWYSDLRGSTRLAETMPSGAFLDLLNVYFEFAARPVIAAGGEVLAFVGDAVLGIFPFETDFELPKITARVLEALKISLMQADAMNAERRRDGREQIHYGIGLNIGEVMYGNIGIPERLAFSAIGPTVIEVARIEKLTKNVGQRVLATRQVASVTPKLWRSIGEHRLEGTGHPQEIFGFLEDVASVAA